MSESMIEKISQAIHDTANELTPEGLQDHQVIAWADCEHNYKAGTRLIARAVLRALREPNERMLAKAASEIENNQWQAEQIFKAMIDTILAEGV